MNVLVIPEDFRKDQYVLAPIIRALFAYIQKPRARIRVCNDPVLGGVTEALKWDRLQPILERYRGMIDIVLLIVDRDGKAGRQNKLTTLERLAEALPGKHMMVGAMAWQEVEVWALAGHTLPKDWGWREIRNHVDPKEAFFLPFARNRGVLDEPGEGRKSIAEESARKYDRIRNRCPELVDLETRIQALTKR